MEIKKVYILQKISINLKLNYNFLHSNVVLSLTFYALALHQKMLLMLHSTDCWLTSLVLLLQQDKWSLELLFIWRKRWSAQQNLVKISVSLVLLSCAQQVVMVFLGIVLLYLKSSGWGVPSSGPSLHRLKSQYILGHIIKIFLGIFDYVECFWVR